MAAGGYVMRKIEGSGRCFGTRCEACVEYFPRLTGWLGVKVVVSTLVVSLMNVQPIATAIHRDCDVAGAGVRANTSVRVDRGIGSQPPCLQIFGRVGSSSRIRTKRFSRVS